MLARGRMVFRASVLAASLCPALSVQNFLLQASPSARPAHFLPASYTYKLPIRLGRYKEQSRHGPQPPWCLVTRGNRRDTVVKSEWQV